MALLLPLDEARWCKSPSAPMQLKSNLQIESTILDKHCEMICLNCWTTIVISFLTGASKSDQIHLCTDGNQCTCLRHNFKIVRLYTTPNLCTMIKSQKPSTIGSSTKFWTISHQTNNLGSKIEGRRKWRPTVNRDSLLRSLPWKTAEGLPGRDLNSGWNWTPT